MIIITGQTATGKTKLALEYAKKYNGELVNFDSRQIYKYLNIITGKDLNQISNIKYQISKSLNIGYYKIPIPTDSTDLTDSTDNQPQATSHQPPTFAKASAGNPTTKLWLYDIIEPNQYFSSFEYVKIAQKVIKNIISRGKSPILVGGTYFYLKYLLYGFDFSVPPDFKLREKLNKKSVEELQKILLSLISPITTIHPPSPRLRRASQPPTTLNINQSDWQNPRRLIRRIEIEKFKKSKNYKALKQTETRVSIFFHFRGDPAFGGVRLSCDKKIEYPSFKIIGLKYKNKQDLINAIKDRVEKRLNQGAVEEVKKVLQMGYKKTDPGLKTIGYKQIIEYLEGKTNLQTAIDKWITAEVQYAKRQYTFMKKDKNITWIEI